MGKKHNNPGPKKNYERRSLNFLQVLIEKYFDRQSHRGQAASMPPANFNEAEVYDRILHSIKRKKTGQRNRKVLLKIAASLALVLSIGFLFYASKNDLSNSLSAANLQEKEVGKGQVSKVTLEDGTKVWLNAGTKLSYPKHFASDSRKVTLIGEAYFEVLHLAKKPFIIQSGAVKTVVLGTSFNISAYPDDQKVEVTVLTGKVAVITPEKSTSKTNTVFLTPNQKITYKAAGLKTAPVKVLAKESIRWKQGKLVFKSATK